MRHSLKHIEIPALHESVPLRTPGSRGCHIQGPKRKSSEFFLQLEGAEAPCEQEADRVANQIMRKQMPGHKDPSLGRASRSPVMPAVGKNVQGSQMLPSCIQDVLSSPGQPLDVSARAFFEPRFGYDFGNVRVHADAKAVESAKALHAQAYAIGNKIVLGEKLTGYGGGLNRKVLAHELAHIVQQARYSGPPYVQRLEAEDVAEELNGREFMVSSPFIIDGIEFSRGELVEIQTWNNKFHTVQVRVLPPHPAANQILKIPKTKILPHSPQVPGVTPYGALAETKAVAVGRAEDQLASERSLEVPRPGEIDRLVKDQPTHWHSLNRKLIQETMFNRFDTSIRLWTDYYNALFRYYPSDPLDPNVVKSILYEESRMGTSGKHLDLVPIWEVRSRFNIGQAVDSAGSALLLMMREMAPELISGYHLENIESDLHQFQSDLANLPEKESHSPDEERRFQYIQLLKKHAETQHMQITEMYLLNYKAPGETEGFEGASQKFFDFVQAGHPRRGSDYDFWIRTTVRWLFEKREQAGSWQEAVRLYNGENKGTGYRNRVMKRAQAAEQRGKSGKQYIPEEFL